MFEFIFGMFISLLLIRVINRFSTNRPIKIDTTEMETHQKLVKVFEESRKR